jgi:hypothetical protein
MPKGVSAFAEEEPNNEQKHSIHLLEIFRPEIIRVIDIKMRCLV